MRNLKHIFGPQGAWSTRTGQPASPQASPPIQAWWQSVINARQLARKMRQRARRLQLLRTVSQLKQRAEQRTRALDSLRGRLEKAIEDVPASTSAYDPTSSVYDTEGSSTDPYSTTTDGTGTGSGNGTGTGSASVKQPSSRTLFAVFERLDSEDFTKNGYPKVSIVNDMLEDRGHERADKETIDTAYDRWWHDEKADGDSDDEGEGGKPTQKVLFSIFEKFAKHKGNDEYFTEDDLPRVSAVDRELDKRGYADTNQKDLHKAYRAWQKEEKEEDEELGKGNGKKPTRKVLFAVFEKLERHKGNEDYFTEDDYPRVTVVNRELEKKDWADTNQEDLHKAYRAWKKEEEEEGER